MKIYVNKGNYGWQTQAKNGDDRMYIDVNFKKGIEPKETFLKIDIKDAFFSMYRNNQNYPKPKLVIMDYEKISKEEFIPNDEEQNPFEITSDDDLPF